MKLLWIFNQRLFQQQLIIITFQEQATIITASKPIGTESQRFSD